MNHRRSKFPKRSIEGMIAMGCNVRNKNSYHYGGFIEDDGENRVIENRKLFNVGLNWCRIAYEGRVNSTQACTCKITSII